MSLLKRFTRFRVWSLGCIRFRGKGSSLDIGSLVVAHDASQVVELSPCGERLRKCGLEPGWKRSEMV